MRVVGHSIGEVSAAHIAGVFSLEDACALVAARATLMGALPEGGAMVAVEAGADELDLPEGVAVAALNTPTSTVISGPEEPVLQLAAEWKAQGRKTKRLAVSHAFHSPLMEPMLEDFRRAIEGLRFDQPTLPLISNLTGRPADEHITTPDYWCEHIRQPVHFAPALTHLGASTYLELGPDPVLTTATQHTLDSDPLTVSLLTAKQPETRAFAHALAQLHTHGHDIDWTPWFPPGPTIDLPTYAFQRQRYWLDGTGSGTGDAVGLGMVASGHPLLGGAMEVADESNVVLTGRVAASGEQRWLADHRVLGSVLVPGAAMAEWALRAADEVGCGGVEELVLQAPLVLPENGAVNVQVLVEAATPDGRRRIRIYARPVQEEHDANGWLCHAEGTLGPRPAAESASDGESVWPPSSAEPVDIDGFYERAAAFGYGYGPAFQGVRAVWRDGHDGRELLAEVELPEAAGGPEGFGIHPALLDAALHPGLLLTEAPDDDRAWLPFAWNGVVLRAADATTVRVRITVGEDGARGERSLRVSVTDPLGAPVLSVDSLVLYPVEAERLRVADRDDGRALFALDWVPLAEGANVAPGPAAGENWAVLGTDPLPAPMDPGPTATATATGYADLDALVTALDAGAAAPPVVLAGVEPAGDGLETTQHVLALLRGWLAEARLADSRLVVVTRGAVDADDGDADPAGAAVWGLVRSAQVEEPDRFVLLDLGDGAEVDTAIGAVRSALAADRPQVAVRDGRVLVPRLSRGGESRRRGSDEQPPELDPHGTVLITGGTGTVGGLVAEHLVRSRGVGHLVLVGRRGPEAPGARDLAERLTGLGADVRLVAVDVADAGAVDELVAGIDPAHPLTGVVHAAGVLDDAVLSAQSPERLARVWAPKAAGALNLHRATADLPLSMFVLFSSAAACLGNGGQANYTAANAFCDGLAAHRRAAGQPGVSVGWGLWDEASGMTGHLTEADRARLSRSGSTPLTTEQALALLELALRHGDPYLLAAHLNRRALGAFGGGGAASGPQRRAAARETGGAGGAAVGTELADRLAELDETGRLEVLLGVVADCAAGALGHRSADELRVEASFKDLGFDSLTAVELRNRLSAATGVRLPATLVFDYPTPQALAGYLVTRLSDAYGGQGAAGRSAARAAVGAPAVAADDEPIAIVSMAGRYPGGVGSPEDLWDLVASGRDAIGAFPDDRGWDLAGLFHPDPDHPGTSYASEGGFVRDAAAFDAAFFGVNPREALAMDPQQRLLLETAWQVLERAGIKPGTLKGSRTGVYAGVMYHDYAVGAAGADAQLEGYAMLAGSGSVVSGRVAYTLGLEGPTMTVDTACSSSLVAMHLAAQALRQGECELALAGGVTVLATPEVFTSFSRQRGLARDGRCKAFSAAADGVGWSEGVGLVLLERLSDARRNGHRVLAVLRGSAVNQDGASNGLTAPNGPSQERVIRQALANAGLAASDVDVVEGHGTGTTLGDPIEAQALLSTYGQERSGGRPLWLGSVKSNIGHTQAAAGVAGVIKVVQAMRHGVLPASLHIDEPSPHVDWESGAVRLLTEPVEWPEGERPRRAAVSSFGVSGTNAHVIVEEPPVAEESVSPVGADVVAGVVPWVVSARGAEALRGQAAALAQVSGAVGVVGRSLVTSRSLFEERAVVLGQGGEELLGGVRALAAGEPHPSVIPSGQAPGGGLVWLFSGQGSQRVGMGAELYARFPVFAEAFDQVCGLLDPQLGVSLREVVFEGSAERLEHTTCAQAGLFALQVGLARLLESFGVRPDAVVGHSIGEVTAAYVAGVFSLEDACALVAARATLMGALPEGGAMVAVEAGAEELDLLEGVAVAALNTPTSTVISGPEEPVLELAAEWKSRGRKTKRLAVSHAFHSPLMEPMLEDFRQAIEQVQFHQPTLPLISNLTGRPADEHITTPDYWCDHIRQPVHFAPALTHLGTHTYLELGPDPVLTTATQHTLEDNPLTLYTLTAKQPETRALAHALAQLHTHGHDIDWTPWFPPGPTIDLPTYAFQRQHYWLAPGHPAEDIEAAGLRSLKHPLLPAVVATADGGLILTGRVAASGEQRWLADHQVLGSVLVPGAAMAEWALRAADEVGCGGVEELILQAPLVLPDNSAVDVQVVVRPAEADERRQIEVYSRPSHEDRDANGWVCHASGTLAPQAGAAEDGSLEQWPPPGAHRVDTDDFYAGAAAAGYRYGPAFQGVRAVWREGRDGQELLAEIELPEEAGRPDGFTVHPALLDAALHPGLLLAVSADDDRAWLPFAWNGVTVWATHATAVRVRLTPLREGESGDERGVRVLVTDVSGAPVLSVDSVVMRQADVSQLVPVRGVEGQFVLDWVPPVGYPASAAEDEADWALLGPDMFGLSASASAVGCHSDVEALVDALGSGAPTPSAVLACVGGDRSTPSETPDDDAEALAVSGSVLGLLQSWLVEPRLTDVRLVLVTRGAVTTDVEGGGAPDMAGAAAWGLVRSAQVENPDRFVLLDLGGGPEDVAGIDDALRHARADGGESQLALRAGQVHVPRLARTAADRLVPLEDGCAWRLGQEVAGTVEDVSVVSCPEVEEPLASGQVRVAVRAAGVNFRDVLIALGMYPEADGLFAGSEGAGVVTEVGPDVTGLAPGDRVMGLFDGAFGPVAVADARMIAPVPDGWDWRTAASVPITFLTAWFGLVELAGLRRGESVLIHAATGGVGSAAVQIARYVGAEVYATAGPGKQGVLAGMGIDAAHRASSRDVGFASVFPRVDVVLNSLAGDLTDASLGLLGPGGRFIEMGKTDVRGGEGLAGVLYRAFDLVPDCGAEGIGRMLGELCGLFGAGVLVPASVRAWPLVRAREALRFMSQARHVGKVVLDVPVPLDVAGTVLVTGGTGTLGGLVAEHLVRSRGVRHLVLVSRRGPDAPGAQDLTERLTELGAETELVAADMADSEAVDALIAGIDPAHPLTGVVHAAGVLDDAVLASQSAERLAGVWGPKATAAYNLHRATAHLPLSFFVVLSSSTAALGSPGQANYAAANAFCDALAVHRRSLGLPGVSVGWGLWAEASGMSGGLGEADLARMARSGVGALATDRALELFDSTRHDGRPHLLAVDLDVRALATQPAEVLPPALRALAGTGRGGAGGAEGRVRRAAATAVRAESEDWSSRLAGLSAGERHRVLLDLVRGHVATVLGHADPEGVQEGASFKDLGFDSLTAVELRNRLGAATGLRLPPALIFDYPRVGALAEELLERVAPQSGTSDGGPQEVFELEPVLDELARLEGTLGAAALRDGDARAVTSRLEDLLHRWRSAQTLPGDVGDGHGQGDQNGNGNDNGSSGGNGNGSGGTRLQDATADQLLDFIDNELGAP
nr:PKS [Streptomyces sp.]